MESEPVVEAFLPLGGQEAHHVIILAEFRDTITIFKMNQAFYILVLASAIKMTPE